MGLVKRFRGDLLPDINPTIPTARAKRWDEARQWPRSESTPMRCHWP